MTVAIPDDQQDALRRHCFGVAYRMLGSVSEAEDVEAHAADVALPHARLDGDDVPGDHVTPALVVLAPSPLTRLHRSIARRYTAGPEASLAEVDALAAALDRDHLYHATRADMLGTLGRSDEARAANRGALKLTANPAEQAVLRRRIDWSDDAG